MAESRTIRTILELNSTGYVSGAARASAASRSLASEMSRLGSSGSAFQKDYDRVGTTLMGVGTAAVAGLGLATKAAMDWESAWAGVTKTVDGTPEQMASLESELRGLAKTLPATHEEIAGVAEAAGQLGVQRENIAGFTKTMIDLGETTNLSADEAATAIAQFSNVMHVSAQDTDNFGAALVDLGNKGASTEADIMSMASRLSSAGALVGASSQDILGLSSALADVGVSAEAGGGSISRVLQKMNTAVLDGGDSLEQFAQVAGVSADEFSAKWRESPVQAMALFEQGLQGVTDNGGNAVQTLKDLGIRSSEETRAVLALASNYDGLAASLETSNTAWDQNTALVAEATKRYETTESKIKMARNAIVDAAIDLGGTLLPVLADAAEGAAGIADAFGNLPGPVQDAIALLGLAAGGGALAAGGLMKIVPAAMDTIDAFRRLKTESPQVASALGRVGKAVGIATLAFAAVSAISSYGDSLTDFSIGANEAADTAMKLAKSADPLGATFAGMGMDADLAKQSTADLASGLDVLANGRWWAGIQDAGTNVLNVFGANNATLAEQKQRLEDVGQGLAGLAQTDLPAAQASFKSLFESMGGSQDTFDNLLAVMPAFRDQLVGIADSMGVGTDNATLLKIATGELAPAASDAASGIEGVAGANDDGASSAEAHAEALSDLSDQMDEAANAFLGARGSMRDYQQAIDDATDALEKNGRSLDIDTQAGRDNQAALDGIASSGREAAAAQLELTGNTDEANGVLADARQHFIDTAEAMGMSADEAESAADQAQLLGDAYSSVPSEVETTVVLNSMSAEEKVDAYVEKFGEVPPSVLTEVGVDSKLAEMNLLTVGSELDEFDATTVTADLSVDTEAGRGALIDLESAINTAGGTVTINGNAATGEQMLNTLVSEINASDGTVTIDGESVPADQALDTLINRVNSGDGTITIKGNNSQANSATDRAVGKANSSTGTINVNADTWAANRAMDNAARDRWATIHVKSIISGGISALPRAEGGWVTPPRGGLAAGGWVPGAYPGKGIDNVAWPMLPGAAGGRMLTQPLAGTEYVVNGQSARTWGPALEAINAGMTPEKIAKAVAGSSQAKPSALIDKLVVNPVEGQSPREQGQYIAGFLGTRLTI